MLLLVSAANCRAAVDASFQLSAGAADLAAYFPGYLGNGYVLTLSGPRGTEATRAYMVGLMDYAAGDISRPAAIPGWTEIDFSATAHEPGQSWLNKASLEERHFKEYRQTLDLHEATLTTSYRYVDGARQTAVEVVTLISQASPHLAATRFTITPDYDGDVQLSFPLMLWAEHAPRFPLAQLSGPEMEEAVAANGLALEARPPATPDREPLWYPGYTAVRSAAGDGASSSLWLDAQAEQGLPMAMAAAIGLPEGAAPVTVTVVHDRYRLALDVRLRVERGHTYVFTKYVTVSRSGWGGSASDDLALARDARARGFEELRSAHRAAWDTLWQADILIEGDAQAQQVAHSELYYLLASSTPDTAWPLGACALTPGYAGHAFWDSDTWIFPALLLLHPQRAKSLVAFRERTLPAARQRAQERRLEGAMYPWEADPENGSEQTPHFAGLLGESEIHVNADIAIAQWQYFLATQDLAWLRAHGWPVIRDVARFWASRASYDTQRRQYVIAHLTSVAESHTDITNDTFTNVSAAAALNIAAAAARRLGEAADPHWQRIATGLHTPFDPRGQHHLPFDESLAQQSGDFGDGPLALLFLPSLDLAMDPHVRRNDYAYAVRPAPVSAVAGFSMGIPVHVIAADTIGSGAEAEAWFATNFTGGTLKRPFNVRTETAGNNTGYFLTGSGGYLQSLIYGFTGLRIRDVGLVEAYAPVLPARWTSLTLRNLSFRGQRLDIRIARDAAGVVRLKREVHERIVPAATGRE